MAEPIKNIQDWEQEYIAQDGQLWVCAVCGRHGKVRTRIGDESCFLNAVLCYETPSLDPSQPQWKAVTNG